jgi:hypothetical protein
MSPLIVGGGIQPRGWLKASVSKSACHLEKKDRDEERVLAVTVILKKKLAIVRYDIAVYV